MEVLFAKYIGFLRIFHCGAQKWGYFHENTKEINSWYSEYGYDFRVSVDKIGPRGETEIMHKKDKFKNIIKMPIN